MHEDGADADAAQNHTAVTRDLAVKGETMGAGCPGDHPLSDLFIHHLRPFPEDMCELLRLIKCHDYTLVKQFEKPSCDWEAGRLCEEGRSQLLDILENNGIRPDLSMLSLDHVLSTTRAFYSQGLQDPALRRQFFRLCRFYIEHAKTIQMLPELYVRMLERVCTEI